MGGAVQHPPPCSSGGGTFLGPWFPQKSVWGPVWQLVVIVGQDAALWNTADGGPNAHVKPTAEPFGRVQRIRLDSRRWSSLTPTRGLGLGPFRGCVM